MWINNKVAFVHMHMKFPSAFGGYFIHINNPFVEFFYNFRVCM